MITLEPLKITSIIFAFLTSISLSGCGGSSSSDDGVINTQIDCKSGVSDFSGCWSSSCSVENVDGIETSSILVIRYKETNVGDTTSGEKNTYGVHYDNANCSGGSDLVVNVFIDSVARYYTANDKVACLEAGGTQLNNNCEKIDIEHFDNNVKNDLLSVTSTFHVNNRNTLCLPFDKTTDDESSEVEFIDLDETYCYKRFTF